MRWGIFVLTGLFLVSFALGAGGSGTQSNFNIAGCDWGEVGLAADSCSYDGNYYCGNDSGSFILYDTFYDSGGCAYGGTSAPGAGQPQCCPIGYECVDDPSQIPYQGLVCVQRLSECSNQKNVGDCESMGCYWLNGACIDRPADYSCDVYETESACLEDTFSLGQMGVGTEVCGTYFVVNSVGFVIPFDSCRCGWTGSECKLNYEVLEEIHGGNENTFRCVKGFEIGNCTEGIQLVKWGALPQVIAGYAGSVVNIPYDVLSAAGCVSNSEGVERDCGAPIVKLFGFSLFSLFVSIGIVYLFYYFRKD